jgi:hypothetical protein
LITLSACYDIYTVQSNEKIIKSLKIKLVRIFILKKE